MKQDIEREGIGSLIGPGLMWLITFCLTLLTILIVGAIIARFQAEILLADTREPMPLTQTRAPQGVVAPKLWEPPGPNTPIPDIKPESKSTMTPQDMRYEKMFQEIALQYNLDWRLLAELAYQESRMNPLAIGKDNDMGLMQIIPSTWNEWAPQVDVSDPFDPYSNILVGAAYLAYVRDYAQTRGRPEDYWMLIGYNWGMDNLDRLFNDNGHWPQVPDKQRSYALAILQAATNSSRRWQERLPE